MDRENIKNTGYEYTISCPNKTEPQKTYEVVAVPSKMGPKGRRVFCTDETQFVRYSSDGNTKTCVEHGEPVESGLDARDSNQSNEDSAIFSLRMIDIAQSSYAYRYSKDGFTCTLADLQMPAKEQRLRRKLLGF